jgi:hypothetical protein
MGESGVSESGSGGVRGVVWLEEDRTILDCAKLDAQCCRKNNNSNNTDKLFASSSASSTSSSLLLDDLDEKHLKQTKDTPTPQAVHDSRFDVIRCLSGFCLFY